MEPKEKILSLIARLQELPVGNDTLLREFLTDLKTTIHSIFSDESQYLDYLKYIKFKPEAVFITEKERERSWFDGSAQVDNLLRVLLNDSKVCGQDFLSDTDDNESLIESDVQQSLGELKQTIIEQHPELEPQSITQAQWTDRLAETDPDAAGELFKEKDAETKTTLPNPGISTVLCVPGLDEQLHQEVMGFLNNLHVKIISIPKVAGQESLMERINHCVDAEFVVFVLSADFHVYSRNQRPVDANVAASQEAVFVLGYLAAKFDRQKIVVLYKEEPDFLCPTQFFDLFYVPVSSAGTWKNEVLRRMNSKLSIPAGLGLSLEKQPVNEIAG